MVPHPPTAAKTGTTGPARVALSAIMTSREVVLVSDSTALLLAWLEFAAVLTVLAVVLLRRSS